MASTKSANIRLGLNPNNAISGLKKLDKASTASARRMESALGSSLNKVGQRGEVTANRISRAFGKTNLTVNGAGVMNTLNKIEQRAIKSAAKIKEEYKQAFSGVNGGKGATAGISKAAKASGKGGLAKGVAVGTLVGGLAKDLLMGVASKGVDIVGDMLVDANTVFEKANRLSINSREAGGQYVDPKVLAAEAYAVSQDVKGTSAEDAVDAATAFVTMTGDLKTARSSLKDFAMAASASDAKLVDVAKAAAAIQKNFGITNPTAMKDALAALIYQGKGGAFELADVAELMPRVAATGKAFGLEDGNKGLRTLGGMLQLSMDNTGQREVAVTSLENLMVNISNKAKKIEALDPSMKVYEGKGADAKMRDLPDIVVDLISKAGGTDVKSKNAILGEILGEQGKRSVNSLIATHENTFRDTKGTDAEKRAAAEAAVRAAMDKSIKAVGSWPDVIDDVKQKEKDLSARWVAASQQIQQAVGGQLLPKLIELSEKFAGSPDAIAAFVSAIEGAASVLEWITMALQGLGILDKASPEVKAKMERDKFDKLNRDIRNMQVSKEDWAKLSPEKQKELADKFDQMDRKRNTSALGALEYDVEATGKDGVDPRKVGDLYGMFKGADVHNPPPGTVPPQPAPLPTPVVPGAPANAAPTTPAAPRSLPVPGNVKVDNTVNVKVVNASEMKGNNSPAPGFVPRS